MKLEDIRKRIDEIDDKIFSLIVERVELVESVKKIKERENLPVYQPKREKEILNRIEEKSKNHYLDEKKIKEIYEKIIIMCREVQTGKS